jgi:Putative Ig domain/RTX calcium-binding nonapeptide repeat (4 copies)
LPGNDMVMGGLGDDTLSGGAGDDYLSGDGGSDILRGGPGADVLYADSNYSDTANDLLDGGAGNDNIQSSVSNDLIIGGAVNDYISPNDGNDVILFNRGDGFDTVDVGRSQNGLPADQRADTVSLGGGIAYADLSLSRDADDLILNTGGGEGIIFSNWFGWEGKAIKTLQVVAEGMAGYDQASADPLLHNRIYQLAFVAMANQFETDSQADPSLTNWEIAPHILSFLLSGSDTGAIGGDMAYLYGTEGNVDRLSEAELRRKLNDAQFGVASQAITKFNVAGKTFDDPDFIHGDTLTYSAQMADGSPLPDWLSFDPATRTFSGTPVQGQAGIRTVSVVATDNGGLSATASFALDITDNRPPNSAPTIGNPLTDQNATEDAAFAFTVPANTFDDVDFAYGDSLSYGATLEDGGVLPGWLTFDASTRSFNGTPGNSDVGSLSVRVTATDVLGASAADVFLVAVANVNYAPTDLALSSHTVAESAPDATVGTLSTTDVDAGDNFIYSILTGADGAQFAIAGNELRVGSTGLDIEAGATRTLNIRTTDAAGAYFDGNFAIDVTDVAAIDHAPVVSVSEATVLMNEAVAVSVLLPTTDAHGDETLQYSLYDYVNGGGYFQVNGLQQGAQQWFTVSGADLINTQYVGGSIPGDETAAVRVSDGMSERTPQNVTMNTIGGMLRGGAGPETLNGDPNTPVLEGGAGDDTLNAGDSNSLLSGGGGADALNGGAGDDLLAGGVGDDTIATGDGHNVIAYNAGDGQDTVTAGANANNALSLGGGINYSDLALEKSGNNLIVDIGVTNQVTLQNWYADSANHSVAQLQVISEVMAGYDPNGSDPLLMTKIARFDFSQIVSQFDQAQVADHRINRWGIVDALLDAHLASSDTEAIGSDLAYQYGKNGTLAGLALTPVQNILSSAQFGSGAQTLQPLAGLQEGLVKLG